MLYAAMAVTAMLAALFSWPFQTPVKQTAHNTYPIAMHGTLRVTAPSGDIDVRAWDGASVDVVVHKRATSQAVLDALKTDVTIADGSVEIKTVYPHSCSNCDVSYEIRVPRGVSLVADSSNGDLRGVDIGAAVTLTGSSGDISVVHAGGPVTARTANGKISVDGASASVFAKTSSGDIELRGVLGDVNAQNSSGDVQAHFSGLNGVRTIALETASGDVTLDLPRPAGATIAAATSSGTIKSDLGQSPHEGYAGATLSQTIGDGRVHVQLTTSSGNIALHAI